MSDGVFAFAATIMVVGIGASAEFISLKKELLTLFLCRKFFYYDGFVETSL
ncbi:MAG: hypothetical protein JKY02_00800 [Flavobacteriaceae bacterium]|nr:hypothetical protein [Flavobacteriaceae bacterium]